MHKTNTIFLIFTLILINISCEQSKKRITTISKTKNVINNLKKFNYESLYQIRVQTSYNYEVRVNDIVVIRRIVDGDNNVININQSLFKSGEQDLTITVLPQSISREKDKDYLEQDVSFYVKIEETAWKNGSLVAPKTIFEYNLPEEDLSGNEINYTKLKLFKTQAKFKAEVPYTLESWQDSKVFKLENIKEITPKVLAFYKKIKAYHENQQGEKYVDLLKKGSFNLYQSNYFDSIKATERDNNFIEFINKKPRPLAGIKNYKLSIMGDGKLLGLVRTDGYNKGEGVLRRYYIKNAFKKVSITEVLLHMPKGSNEFEVIWNMGYIKPVPLDEE